MLLSCLSFGTGSESDPDSEFDVDYMDAMINRNKSESLVKDSETTTTTKNVIASNEERSSYRSMESPSGVPTTTSGDGFDPSKIFQHYDEQVENLGCGFGNPHDMDAFSGQRAERESHFGEFPWMVAISENGSFLGGGALIAPDIVITLASLFLFPQSDSDNLLQVVAGEWDVRSELEILPHLNRDVASIIKHPQFNGYDNDIALLVLRLGFSKQPNIRTVCLPTPATVIDHRLCISTAWSLANSKPKKFKFQIQPRIVCESRLASPYNTIYTSVICASHVDDSTSNPISSLPLLNSGAALFCPMAANPNRYTQLGIVIGATDRNGIITGLFVNVSQFMPWIFKELGPRNTDLKYYLP
ncbi:hypothetical protein ACLKA6_014066 [Drosophila palustris]